MQIIPLPRSRNLHFCDGGYWSLAPFSFWIRELYHTKFCFMSEETCQSYKLGVSNLNWASWQLCGTVDHHNQGLDWEKNNSWSCWLLSLLALIKFDTTAFMTESRLSGELFSGWCFDSVLPHSSISLSTRPSRLSYYICQLCPVKSRVFHHLANPLSMILSYCCTFMAF